MFEIEDLAEIARSRQFLDDCKFVLRTLAINRLGEGELFQSEVDVAFGNKEVARGPCNFGILRINCEGILQRLPTFPGKAK